MDAITMTSVALGLSALAGLNLYLTVFTLGWAIRLGWLQLTPDMAALEVLSHPAILALAGFLVLVEFVADKIPWVDSLWDGIHTLIRPLGGIFLALGVVGVADPLIATIAGLAGGSLALSTHLSKSSARLLVNTSPEPFSNSAVSILEDVFVLAGVGLIVWNPWLALGLLILFVLLFIWLAPKILRHLLLTGHFLLSKIQSLTNTETIAETLPTQCPVWARQHIEKIKHSSETMIWIIPTVIDKIPSLPKNRRGYIFGLSTTGRIGVLVKGKNPVWITTQNTVAHIDSRFLYDELGLISQASKDATTLRFAKNLRPMVNALLCKFGPEQK